MNDIGISTRLCVGSCSATRAADATGIDVEKRKIPFTLISENNAGERFDWWEGEVYIEELDVNGANFQGLRTFFTDHNLSVDNAIGRVENKRIEGSALKADVFFGTDSRSSEIFQKYLERILTDVSIGYRVKDIIVTPKKDEPTHVLVTDFDIVELSAVWRGFDSGANIGRQKDKVPMEKIMDNRNIDTLKRQLELKEKLL